ncbi:interferon alpha-inducible protein 27-like protein 2A [Suncus etruscus]|uniref:interferon alpha-inducible protein 27-like protein 2A n=1 Tax=Suncus etruscus TaxID=109475 RepID=UPI002110482E|nr:interferon alpha-inducible protein 27-like protein 2A [Suncus etruscus]
MYGKVIAGVVGGAVTVAAVPVVLGAVGFTGTGIAASSIAAKMMSAAAVANGGGVAAGSLVATLQSVGMGGLSITSNILLGSSGSALGAWLWSEKNHPLSDTPLSCDSSQEGDSPPSTSEMPMIAPMPPTVLKP